MTSADVSPEQVDTLRSWRRTGLVTGYAAVLCLGASVVWRLVGPAGSTVVVVLAGSAVLLALVAYAYLRRLWTDPLMSVHPAASLLRRMSGVTVGAYGLAVVPNIVRAGGPELPAVVEWSTVLLSTVAVVGFLGLLVVVGRRGHRP